MTDFIAFLPQSTYLEDQIAALEHQRPTISALGPKVGEVLVHTQDGKTLGLAESFPDFNEPKSQTPMPFSLFWVQEAAAFAPMTVRAPVATSIRPSAYTYTQGAAITPIETPAGFLSSAGLLAYRNSNFSDGLIRVESQTIYDQSYQTPSEVQPTLDHLIFGDVSQTEWDQLTQLQKLEHLRVQMENKKALGLLTHNEEVEFLNSLALMEATLKSTPSDALSSIQIVWNRLPIQIRGNYNLQTIQEIAEEWSNNSNRYVRLNPFLKLLVLNLLLSKPNNFSPEALLDLYLEAKNKESEWTGSLTPSTWAPNLNYSYSDFLIQMNSLKIGIQSVLYVKQEKIKPTYFWVMLGQRGFWVQKTETGFRVLGESQSLPSRRGYTPQRSIEFLTPAEINDILLNSRPEIIYTPSDRTVLVKFNPTTQALEPVREEKAIIFTDSRGAQFLVDTAGRALALDIKSIKEVQPRNQPILTVFNGKFYAVSLSGVKLILLEDYEYYTEDYDLVEFRTNEDGSLAWAFTQPPVWYATDGDDINFEEVYDISEQDTDENFNQEGVHKSADFKDALLYVYNFEASMFLTYLIKENDPTVYFVASDEIDADEMPVEPPQSGLKYE